MEEVLTVDTGTLDINSITYPWPAMVIKKVRIVMIN